MNEPENLSQPLLPQPRSDSSLEELRDEVQTLRAVVSFTVLLVFVFTICINVYLFQQARLVSQQSAQAMAVVKGFDGAGAQQANDFLNRANEYARTHPDYQPIFNRYAQLLKPGAPKK